MLERLPDDTVYVVDHSGRAGNSLAAIQAHGVAYHARGVEDKRVTYSNRVRQPLYRDPDRNELNFGRAAPDAG